MESAKTQPPPLLRIPLELRRHIYSFLLTPEAAPPDNRYNESHRSIAFIRDYQDYERTPASLTDQPTKMLQFRNSSIGPNMTSRTKYKVRSGRLRSACEDASYTCANKPDLATTIFRVSRQIHEEAAEYLYGSFIFDFYTHIEACVPFLMDLTPFTRSCIRHVSIVKRALPYDKDFDRCEWSNMCDFLSREMQLQGLSLGVIAGKPTIGWDGIVLFNKEHIDGITRSMDEMSWVNDVAGITGLQRLDVRACIEHSPPPMSNAMAFFVAFSASVEPYFAEYLTSRMIQQAA